MKNYSSQAVILYIILGVVLALIWWRRWFSLLWRVAITAIALWMANNVRENTGKLLNNQAQADARANDPTTKNQ